MARMLDAIPGQCALLDEDGVILCANRHWRNPAEANPGPVADGDPDFGVGSNYLAACDFAAGDGRVDASMVAAGLRSLLAGEKEEFERDYACQSSEEMRWFRCLARAVPGDPASGRMALVQHLDVTRPGERRPTADDDKHARPIWISNRAGPNSWHVNPASQTITLSPALSRLLGWTNDATLAIQEWTDRIAREDVSAFKEALDALVRGGSETEQVEVSLEGADGSLRRLSLTGWRSVRGKGDAGVEGIAVDVTEKWNSARALAASEKPLWALFNVMPIRVASLDRSFRYRFVNQTFANGLQLMPDEIVGALAEDILGAAAWRIVEPLATRALGGEVASMEAGLILPSGEAFQAKLTYLPNRNDQGTVIGVYAVVQDIGDLKRREAELVKAKEAAEAANNAKSTFIASMSHELRTPLNAIIGFADILSDESYGSLAATKMSDYAGHIRSSGKLLLAMVDDILDLAALESGRRTLDIASVDLCAVIQECLKSVEVRAENKGIRLSSRTDQSARRIETDPMAIRQVLLNLLTNAVKFTDGPGSVHVDVLTEGDRTRIKVSDTGRGIPKEALGEITKPFVQLDGTESLLSAYSSGIDKGWGLGLAITRSLVHQLNGTLDIVSVPDIGSEFTVHLPTARQREIENFKQTEDAEPSTGQAPLCFSSSSWTRVKV